jgi:hypothetical protein
MGIWVLRVLYFVVAFCGAAGALLVCEGLRMDGKVPFSGAYLVIYGVGVVAGAGAAVWLIVWIEGLFK